MVRESKLPSVLGGDYFNPFTEQVAGEYFVGREEQLQKFGLHLNGLKMKVPNHIYLAGMHGTGKTSLISKLAEVSIDEGYIASPIPLTLDIDKSPRDQISNILVSIIANVDEFGSKHVPSVDLGLLRDWELAGKSILFSHPKSDQIDSSRIRHDFEVLRDRMSDLNCRGAVICIDEGQRIEAKALSALKNALQSLNCFLVILSLRLVVDTRGAETEGRTLLDDKGKLAEGDYGASRFFVSGLSTGAFDSELESLACIRRRLQDNRLQFDEETMRAICKIAGRVPRDMINFASYLYLRAASIANDSVNISFLNEAFRERYQDECSEAMHLLEGMSRQSARALQGLLALRGSANAEQIADFISPETAPETRTFLVEGIKGELTRLCDKCRFCRKMDDNFELIGSVQSYALGLCLGSI